MLPNILFLLLLFISLSTANIVIFNILSILLPQQRIVISIFLSYSFRLLQHLRRLRLLLVSSFNFIIFFCLVLLSPMFTSSTLRTIQLQSMFILLFRPFVAINLLPFQQFIECLFIISAITANIISIPWECMTKWCLRFMIYRNSLFIRVLIDRFAGIIIVNISIFRVATQIAREMAINGILHVLRCIRTTSS